METLNLPRDHLPQIKEPQKFLDYLDNLGVNYTRLDNHLLVGIKPSQVDYDPAKVDAISKEPEKHRLNPIIASQERTCLDGHHRLRGLLKASPVARGAVIVINLSFPELLGLSRQFLADSGQNLNIGMKTFKEFRESAGSLDAAFEQMIAEDFKGVSPFSQPSSYGDPGYVLRRLKKVPIHTSNVKTPLKTQNTTVGTEYDKIKPTGIETEDYLGPTFDDTIGGAGTPGSPSTFVDEKKPVKEAKSPKRLMDVLRDFDKQRVAAGKKPIFHDRPGPEKPKPRGLFSTPESQLKVEEPTDPRDPNALRRGGLGDYSTVMKAEAVTEASNEPPNIQRLVLTQEELAKAHKEERDTVHASRMAGEVNNIKDRFKKGEMSWNTAHHELLRRGISAGEVPKHLGEATDAVDEPEKAEDDVTDEPKTTKVSKVVGFAKKGKTATGEPKDKVDLDPTLDPFKGAPSSRGSGVV